MMATNGVDGDGRQTEEEGAWCGDNHDIISSGNRTTAQGGGGHLSRPSAKLELEPEGAQWQDKS